MAQGEGFFDGNIFVIKLPTTKASAFFNLVRFYRELCANITLENLLDPNQVYVDENAGVIKLSAKPHILEGKSYLKE